MSTGFAGTSPYAVMTLILDSGRTGVTPAPAPDPPTSRYILEAFRPTPTEEDPTVTYVIAEPCVDLLDKACIEECPVDCIYEGARMLYIHPDECVDCGACEPVCPVEAIYYEDDVPEQWTAYTKANVDFFDELGLAGRRLEGRQGRHGRGAGEEPAAAAARRVRSFDLPDFPWDSLAEDKALAAAHPEGIVDLSVGTPVDPVPEVVRAALSGPAADEPGYPTTHGPASLREAVAGSLARRFGVTVDPIAVLPTIGSKELVAWLPTLLGLGAGDTVVIPELAYPTYEVGARLAGAEFVRTDSTAALGPAPRRAGLDQLAVQPDRAGCCPPRTCARSSTGPGSAAPWWRPTSATSRCPPNRTGRCRCCIPTSAAAPTEGCSRCTRCRSRRTSPATGPGSLPVTRRWSPRCWRCAGTRA